MVNLLLERGADVNQKDANGWTPLLCAVFSRHLYRDDAILAELLRRGADVNARAHSGDTPLTIATERDAAKIVDHLLRLGADVNIKDRYGRTPLMIAEEYHLATLQKMIKEAMSSRR